MPLIEYRSPAADEADKRPGYSWPSRWERRGLIAIRKCPIILRKGALGRTNKGAWSQVLVFGAVA